jgi:hypothetical protein
MSLMTICLSTRRWEDGSVSRLMETGKPVVLPTTEQGLLLKRPGQGNGTTQGDVTFICVPPVCSPQEGAQFAGGSAL